VGTKFLAAIDWAAAVAPSDRPQSAAALRQALGDDRSRTPPSAAPRGGRPAVPALALAAFGVFAVGAWTLGSATMFAAAAPPRISVPALAPSVAPAPSALSAVQPEVGHVSPASPSVALLAPDAMAAAAKPDKALSPVQRPGPSKRPPAAKPMQPAARTEGTAVESRSPSEVCAGRNFFARALCVSRQCQTAGSRMAPECVEARRIEEQRQRRIDP
jgi:hypothetical protein